MQSAFICLSHGAARHGKLDQPKTEAGLSFLCDTSEGYYYNLAPHSELVVSHCNLNLFAFLRRQTRGFAVFTSACYKNASSPIETSDIRLCLGISPQQSRSFFNAPPPKIQPMATGKKNPRFFDLLLI